MKTQLLIILTFCSASLFGQKALTFQDAEAGGIRISMLDSTYPSAVHSDTSKAVFKTEKDQEQLYLAYQKLLQDFGGYLHQHNFKWSKPTRCFNRIYFNPNGTIDYFLFNFLGKTPDEKPTTVEQAEFNRLLNEFIKNYRIDLKAQTNFAQCSPTTYMPYK